MKRLDWHEIANNIGYICPIHMIINIYNNSSDLKCAGSKIGISGTSLQRKMVELNIPRCYKKRIKRQIIKWEEWASFLEYKTVREMIAMEYIKYKTMEDCAFYFGIETNTLFLKIKELNIKPNTHETINTIKKKRNIKRIKTMMGEYGHIKMGRLSIMRVLSISGTTFSIYRKELGFTYEMREKTSVVCDI